MEGTGSDQNSDGPASGDCCDSMAQNLADPRSPLIYESRVRLYSVRSLTGDGRAIDDDIVIRIVFCPWCGMRLPEDLLREYGSLLEELGLDQKDNPWDISDPHLPDEMRTDEWWRKRGL